VLDWNSDVAPSEQDMLEHAHQLTEYLEVTGVSRGALVYMTFDAIQWISRRGALKSGCTDQ